MTVDATEDLRADVRSLATALVRLRIRLLGLREEDGGSYALDAMLEASEHMADRLADLFELTLMDAAAP